MLVVGENEVFLLDFCCNKYYENPAALFSPQGQKQRDIYGWAEKNGVVGTLVED